METLDLVIKINQPFFAASPDDIIFDDGSILEIKCLFTCQNMKIVDYENLTTKVLYLHFDGNIELNKMHKYYTQMAMYVIGVLKCHVFVYSNAD